MPNNNNNNNNNAKKTMRVYSWNVNGLRACTKKGFLKWLRYARADIVGLQETRARQEQLDPAVAKPSRWRTHFVAAERGGYSGVGLYARQAPDDIRTSLNAPEFDREGRVQIARFGKLTVANVYFPNGSGKNRDNSRVSYKLAFYQRLFSLLEEQRRHRKRVLVMGDFNTAHEEIDLARPKSNQKTSGFLPVEREVFRGLIANGWTDTFRSFESGPGCYTWWSQHSNARERNVGWRIDYILASEGAMPFVKAAKIHPRVMGSDHCPVSVDLDPNILS